MKKRRAIIWWSDPQLFSQQQMAMAASGEQEQ